jgi:shikimate kinase
MTPTVVLVGMPGAGKSTTGRRLAKILGVPFADSDDLVAAAAGRPVAHIFAESGEDAFRALEAAAVVAALEDFPGVLALGGGALTVASTRAALRGCPAPVVLLRAELATLGARVGTGRSRPLLVDDPPARLAELATARISLYENVSTFAVDTDNYTPGQVAGSIAARLHELGRK